MIQSFGIDIDQLIDEYNNGLNKIKENEIKMINSKSENDSLSDLDSQIESNSFIPINIEKTKERKISKIHIPKLNFDIINKKRK